jgi:predicted alpha/beta superfamily hydrolase
MAVNAHRVDFTSKTNGKDYRLFISVPAGEAPAGGWPVIYLIDANLHFGILVDTLRIQARWPETRDAVVVGVGYPTDSVQTALAVRNIDLTPPISQDIIDNGWMRGAGMAADHFGGMEAYLQMIEDEAKPLAAKHAPLDPNDQMLMGHSLGGLTTLTTMFLHTSRFQTYAAISASAWFANQWVMGLIDGFAARVRAGEAKARLFLSTGEFEQITPPRPAYPKAGLPISETDWQEMMDDCKMVDLPTEIAARLEPVKGANFDMRFTVHRDEDHRSVVPAGIAGGVYFGLYRPE